MINPLTRHDATRTQASASRRVHSPPVRGGAMISLMVSGRFSSASDCSISRLTWAMQPNPVTHVLTALSFGFRIQSFLEGQSCGGNYRLRVQPREAQWEARSYFRAFQIWLGRKCRAHQPRLRSGGRNSGD